MAISVSAMEGMIRRKEWSEVEAAVEAGFDASCCDFNGSSKMPLVSRCILFGCRDRTVDIIVKNGADPTVKSAYGLTIFHYAAFLDSKTEEDSERLLRKLASLASHSLPPHLTHLTPTHLIQLARAPANSGYLPTHMACLNNNVRGLRVLAEEIGVSVTDVDLNGNSPAHIAASDGSRECLLYLILRHRIPLHAKNKVRSSRGSHSPPFCCFPLSIFLSLSICLCLNVLVSVGEKRN